MSARIESRIEGPFEGWSGETVFTLSNGQVWRQARYAYRYVYRYRPEVVIENESGGWVLRLADEDDGIPVRRID